MRKAKTEAKAKAKAKNFNPLIDGEMRTTDMHRQKIELKHDYLSIKTEVLLFVSLFKTI